MIPRNWNNIRLRTALMVAGGPLASILSGLVALLVLPTHGFISGSFIAVSFWFGLINLLPMGLQGHRTDGATIWMLWFKQDCSRRYLALLRMHSEIDRGVPINKISAGDLEAATHVQDQSADTVKAHLFAYLAASSLKEHKRAEQMLEVALSFSGCTGPSMRELLAIQAALVQATSRNRIDVAEQWLNQVPSTTPFLKMRSQAESTIEGIKTSQSSAESLTADGST